MVRDLVDDLVLVDEDEIAVAMAEAVIEERIVLEGAGATPIAALLHRERDLFGSRIARVATGTMVDPAVLNRIVAERADQVASLLGGSGR